jgi:hypothetical protein
MKHQGDGSFKMDGRFIDLGSRMLKWRELV